ncbi:MAG: hypothetical protein RL653_2489 [Pseudomonadota bacterium]|jgi:serine/threonine-protein kinase
MAGCPPNRLRPFHPVSFGRYTLLMPLAVGGMGEIYLARLGGAAGFEKFCVIKKILPALAQDRAFVERFMGEARVLVRLTHGSIAQVLDMGTVDGEPYMALEFVDGKDLRRLVSRVREDGKSIPVEVALFVMGRVLEALAYAHRKRDEQDREIQLVHRDISPQNVLLSYEGEVKVIDFGLAKSTLSDAKTNPSIILGKFLYMAPEQARHEKVDRRSDLYAVAICLYELLTGKNPFGHLGMTALMEAVMRPKIAPLQEVAPHVPADVCALVARGLEVDPGKRFQSAEEMRGALTAALLKLDPALGQERISAYMREAFAAEFASERRLLQGLREAKAQGPEAAPEPQELPRAGSPAGRRPSMAASTVETAQVQLAAPLGPVPRARTDDRTIPGVRLEDLEREAQDRTPTPEHEPAPVPSMLDEEFLPAGPPTGPTTAPGEAVQLSSELDPEPASIEVSPELFEDEEAQSAAFRPTAKRYPEPDTGKLARNLANSLGTDPNVVVGMTPRTGTVTGPNTPLTDTPREGVPTGPGSAWTGPVTAPVRAVRSGPSWGLWGGVAGVLLLLGGGAVRVLGSKPPAPAPRALPTREVPVPAPVPVKAEPAPAPPAPPEPAPPEPAPPEPAPPPTPTAAPLPEPAKVPPPMRPPEPQLPAPPRPAPSVRPAPATVPPPPRPAAKSSNDKVEEAWGQLRDRMERLDSLCGGNTRQAQKLRARFTGLEPFYRNEERDNDEVLRRIRLLSDDVDGCALEAPR